MSNVVYSNTALIGTTKVGRLNCDASGYYDVVLGAFNAANSQGAWYDIASARSHLDNNMEFMRRINSGAMYGENGHPVPVPGMTKQEWLIRIMTIDQTNRSHHIREITLSETAFKNPDGSPMLTVFGRVKPSGPYADVLAASLENEHENTAFSLRSITNDRYDPYRGRMVKIMRKPVTWDYVIEPGMSIATKYNTPSLESISVDSFTEEHIDLAMKRAQELFSGMEAASIVEDLRNLKDDQRVALAGQVLSAAKLPRSAFWK